MNLTKGKITKLYNKKRQTLKRKINKKKSSNKSKTFRRNRKINLARKSLKRFHNKKYRGGIGEGEEAVNQVEGAVNTVEGEGKPVEGQGIDASDVQLQLDGQANIEKTEEEIVDGALSGDTNPKFASPNVIALENAIEPVTETQVKEATDSKTEAAAEKEILESALKNSTKPEYANSQENALLTDVDSQVVTIGPETDSQAAEEAQAAAEAQKQLEQEQAEEAQAAQKKLEEAQAQKQAEEAQAAQKKLEEAQAAQKKLEEEAQAQKQAEQTQTQVVEAAQPQTQVVEAQVPVTQVTPPPEKGPKPNLSNMSVPSDTSLPPDQQNDKLTQAIDTVVDYIADKVSKKVTINVSSSDYTPQNGYEAVKTAAETMASSKGGKKRKTRKFKLTKKNKTRSRT